MGQSKPVGGSRVGYVAAMRARDVSRPRPEQERAAEREGTDRRPSDADRNQGSRSAPRKRR